MHVKELVKRFGGQTKLANELGIRQSAVAYWVKAGKVPVKWHEKLLTIAANKNIDISAIDLLGINLKSNNLKPITPFKSIDDNEFSFFDNEINDFLFYESESGVIRVQVLLGNETVWATQKGIGEIFDTSRENITTHLINVFNSNELEEKSVCKEILLTAADGKKYKTKFYNLDAIISVGYRVSSYKATQFRRWATTVLKEYLIKGFALDDDRLKQGNQLFGKDYFDELLERIREIRASERRFYQKITDIYSQCSIDYDFNSPISHQFYAHVQDKLHYAIHGHTSAEIIQERANAAKPHMGLTSWKNSAKDGKVLKNDVIVGKNYLNQDELSELNRLVSMFLDSAELIARKQIPMTMKDWAIRLDNFLEFNAYEVLTDFGKVTRSYAEKHAINEYDKFRIKQDKEYKSDFDKIVDEIKSKNSLPKKK